jgi:chromosomal replication initiation ATPase DnaA
MKVPIITTNNIINQLDNNNNKKNNTNILKKKYTKNDFLLFKDTCENDLKYLCYKKNNSYLNTFQDPNIDYERNVIRPHSIGIPFIVDTIFQNKIEEKNIDVDIQNLSDLIKMIDDNPLSDNVKYNINMEPLHTIKPHLIELNNMIGMHNLKNSILDQILYFSQNLHKNNKNNERDFMHTVIYGPPGTGKTEIAKIIGKIYSKIGILDKKNIFKKATRADLVAGFLGQTAIKTKELVNSCIGGVLFIDEAYSLGNTEKRDSFSKECIDTLCEALSEHKNNLMVIIAGYEKELNECFFDYNQGLNSRFTWRFKVDSYSGKELMQIFIKKVDENGWTINVNDITSDWFDKNMEYFKYYGRDVEVLFTKTKIAHSRRVFCKPVSEKTIITLPDIENGFKLFLNNDEVKNRKKHSDIQSDIKFSMYN